MNKNPLVSRIHVEIFLCKLVWGKRQQRRRRCRRWTFLSISLSVCLFVLFCRLQIFSNGSVQKRKGDLTGGKRKWLGLPGGAISQNGTGGGEIPQLTIAHRRRLPLIRWTLKITNLKNNKTSILLSLWTSPCHEWNRYKNHLKDSG